MTNAELYRELFNGNLEREDRRRMEKTGYIDECECCGDTRELGHCCFKCGECCKCEYGVRDFDSEGFVNVLAEKQDAATEEILTKLDAGADEAVEEFLSRL